MTKFIQGIVAFSLKNRFFVFFLTALLIAGGVYSYVHTPIEAFPDVTNTQIIIVSQWPGRSAEEVERFVSVPIEVAMNSVQKKSNMRSISMFGLSVLKINFDDDVDDFYARQQVNNLLAGVSLPDDCDNHVQPPYGPTGEIFRYTVQGKGRSTNELLTLQDWVVERALKSVPGVADIAAFGGTKKVYEITADPARLQVYNLTPLEVFQAVQRSNINVGGDVIEKNGQAYVVRGIGLLENPAGNRQRDRRPRERHAGAGAQRGPGNRKPPAPRGPGRPRWQRRRGGGHRDYAQGRKPGRGAGPREGEDRGAQHQSAAQGRAARHVLRPRRAHGQVHRNRDSQPHRGHRARDAGRVPVHGRLALYAHRGHGGAAGAAVCLHLPAAAKA